MALNRTRAPILIAFNFLVRASQWRVVSPMRKAAKVSARVSKNRGGLLSDSGNCEAIRHVLCLFLKHAMDWRACRKTRRTCGELAEEHCGLFLPRKQYNVPERYLLRDREA